MARMTQAHTARTLLWQALTTYAGNMAQAACTLEEQGADDFAVERWERFDDVHELMDQILGRGWVELVTSDERVRP